MNVAIIHSNSHGDPSVLITDHGDRYLLERLHELIATPDAGAPLPVTLSTGGIWEIGGDTILEAFEVSQGTLACDVKHDYIERMASV